MTETIERRCESCKSTITINRCNIENVVYFQKKYYHHNCFHDMATKKANSKRGKPEMWQDALNRMWELEDDAKALSEQYFIKQDLNDWLLEKYDISAVPSQFWQRVADLEQGIYKNVKCKAISMKTLLETWQWGWQKLNEINIQNKNRNKGPQDDEQRLIYDLSIVIQKVPNFLKYQANKRIKMITQTAVEDVDMSRLTQPKREEKKNISSIFDDLYVE